MRFLAIHVDHYAAEVTEKSRSRLIETPTAKRVEMKEGLLVLMSVEKGDESDPEGVVERAVRAIADVCRQVGTRTVALHSFAHLFADLANPTVAVAVMKEIAERLKQEGYQVLRPPFGWFHTLDIQAKGHPLARVARIVE